jgi:hypothetical protein
MQQIAIDMLDIMYITYLAKLDIMYMINYVYRLYNVLDKLDIMYMTYLAKWLMQASCSINNSYYYCILTQITARASE